MRMFCGSCFFLVSLPFHDTGTFRTKLYATIGMNCIINTAVTRAKTPQHLRICGIDNLVAAQRGDIALPEIQSGLLPLKILICPVETTLMLISDRWKVLILRDLLTANLRSMEKKRARFTKSLSGGSSTCRILADQNRMESETDSRCNGGMGHGIQTEA